jgi:hypothetical protein
MDNKKNTLNPEEMYNKISSRQWMDFLDLLYQHKNEIPHNPVIQQAINVFIGEFLKQINSDTIEVHLRPLEKIFLLHSGKLYKFNEKEINNVVTYLLEHYSQNNLKKAYNLSLDWTQLSISKSIIEEYEKTRPIKVVHNQINSVQVTHNPNISIVDYSIPLFKSNLEYEFFMALVETYPNYSTYPNVAVSCLLDFDQIKKSLTSSQKEYFLKSILDCVIFDPRNKYTPKFFFEIDSHYRAIVISGV